eukprot:TRINITY_DN13998_c0_g1_i1.p1 TRINITY_DN13998_c0_g1~~TRINITY_DN13998_c0_g1_i1.p1  ORF type:complete len:294 (+),score=96.70 TRINITY_DN13998_c0_g1_i1:501-1382(+)
MSSVPSVEGMSVRELKQVIERSGLSHVGLTEKHELVALAQKAAAQGPPPPAPLSAGRSKRTFAGWECEVISPSATPKDVIVVLHGFGATCDDFIPFADHFSSVIPDAAWVFPQAAVDPALGASAWWQIDVQEWVMSVMLKNEQAIAQLIRKEHTGLSECRERGIKLVNEIVALTGLPMGSIHLGGFSQGAMTAVDIGLSLPTPPGSLTMISGAPIVVDQWGEKLAQAPGKHKVFVSHGKNDPVLPFMASGWALKLFEEKGGISVKYVTHNGQHDVGSSDVLQQLGQFWKEACA